MAKRSRKKEGEDMPATADTERTGHVKLEFPPKDFAKLKRAAKSKRLSISAFVRLSVVDKIKEALGEDMDE